VALEANVQHGLSQSTPKPCQANHDNDGALLQIARGLLLRARLTAPELIYAAVFTCRERSASALKSLIVFVFQVLKLESMLDPCLWPL